MNNRVRALLAWALVAALGLGLSIPSALAQQSRDTVVIGMAQEPDCLILSFCSMAAGAAIADNSISVGMVEYNDKWQLFPRMVEKIPTLKDGDWELLPGGKKMKVTYKFKKGFTWHDGKPLTALDTSWTNLMLRNPRSPTKSRFVIRKIDNMLVPDPKNPYTLVVQWNERYPFANTGHTTYPQHVLEREYLRDPSGLRAHKQNRFPIGNGPYKFVEWVPGSHITLEAYDKYPEGVAKIKKQVWRFILDSTVLQANVIANQVDATEIPNFSIDQMIEIEKRNPAVNAHYTPALIWEHIDLKMDHEWLKDKRVRQAIAHSINREEMSAKLFYGKQPVAHTWLPERHEGFNANVKKYAYDPARARALLTEAGFTPGPDGILRDARGQRFELVINTTAGNVAREQVQVIMKEQMRAVGIDLRIDNRPAGVLFGPFFSRRQFPHMIMYAWVMSPTTLPDLWHSKQIPTAANNYEGQNAPGWMNAENDKLIDQIFEEIDAAKRVALLKKQQEIWAEELPSIPLYFRLHLTTSNKKLANVKPAGLSGTYLNWNSDQWLWSQ